MNTRDICIVFGVDERDIVLLHANVILAAFYKFRNTVFAQAALVNCGDRRLEEGYAMREGSCGLKFRWRKVLLECVGSRMSRER